MNDPKALALFKEVLAKTEARKLAWESTASEHQFLASMGTFTLIISSQDEYGSHDPWLGLNDSDSKRILTVDDHVDGVSSEELLHLHELARRRALRSDEKIESVLDSLRKL